MNAESPNVVVLAGPNGAGKSTFAPALLRDSLSVKVFVNADVIARGLSGFDPLGVAIQASRIMHERVRELAAQRVDFAFETTLAARSLAPWLSELKQSGYNVHVIFLWLPTPDLAVRRVAYRVQMGGHDVPEETVRRRYRAGVRNFFRLYQAIATTWRVYDNSQVFAPEMIVEGAGTEVVRVIDRQKWEEFQRGAADETGRI